jgi:hypothetical protein
MPNDFNNLVSPLSVLPLLLPPHPPPHPQKPPKKSSVNVLVVARLNKTPRFRHVGICMRALVVHTVCMMAEEGNVLFVVCKYKRT